MCTRNAMSVVKEQFASRDPEQMAELSGAVYADGKLTFAYCSIPVAVSYPEGTTTVLAADHAPLSHDEQVLLLQYLNSACGLPPRGHWLSFLDLRGGPLHWLPFQREALNPLARRYHDRLHIFLAEGMKYGGEETSMGDRSITIPVFPRLSLNFIIWQGDEEFEPRSTILFDSVAESYLTTAALYVMAIKAMVRIWFPGDTRFDEAGGD